MEEGEKEGQDVWPAVPFSSFLFFSIPLLDHHFNQGRVDGIKVTQEGGEEWQEICNLSTGKSIEEKVSHSHLGRKKGAGGGGGGGERVEGRPPSTLLYVKGS